MKARKTSGMGITTGIALGFAAVISLCYQLRAEAAPYSAWLLLGLPLLALLCLWQRPAFSACSLGFGLWLGGGMYALLLTKLEIVFQQLNASPLVGRGILLAACGCGALVFATCLAGLGRWLAARAALPGAQPGENRLLRDTLLFALYAALSLALFAAQYDGFLDQMDTMDQFRQITGQVETTAIHAIGHTLLLKGLYALLPTQPLMVAVGLAGVCLLMTLLVRRLLQKGVSVLWPLLLFTGVLWGCDVMKTLVMLLKDVPYTLCMGLTVYYLWRVADGELLGFPACAILGLSLGLTVVFRLNGFVPVALTLLALFVRYGRRRDWKRPLCILAVCVLVIAGVNGAAEALLRPVDIPNGNSYYPFAFGVATVIAEGGVIPEAQQAVMDQLLPTDFIRAHYNPWLPTALTWSRTDDIDPRLALLNNPFGVAVAEHPGEIIRLYFALLPHNLSLMIKSVVHSVYPFVLLSSPHLWENHAVLLAVLLFAALTLWKTPEARKGWLVLVPVMGNLLSILISTITGELRYVLPTYLLFPVLLPYMVSKARACAPLREPERLT